MLPRQFATLCLTFFLTILTSTQTTKQELNDQMWEATRRGDATAVAALLDKGADVNAKFRYGATALFKAADIGNVEVVKVLLAHGADVKVKDTFYGASAMDWALNHKHVEVIRLLLEKDAENVGDVLMTGVREGNVPLVRIALDKGGLKPETLTAALVASKSSGDSSAEITDLLKKAGAVPPPEIDAATLQSYVGKYKSERGFEVNVLASDGKLSMSAPGQPPLALMPLDKVTFRPTAFDGMTLVFTVEGGTATGISLKQGANTTELKRVSETKQP